MAAKNSVVAALLAQSDEPELPKMASPPKARVDFVSANKARIEGLSTTSHMRKAVEAAAAAAPAPKPLVRRSTGDENTFTRAAVDGAPAKKPAVPTRDDAAKRAPAPSDKNFIAENAQKAVDPKAALAASRAANRDRGGEASVKHEEYGQVPSYLKERQAQWAKDEEDKKKKEAEADVPKGMRLMPESERLETLELLRASVAETQKALTTFKLRLVVPSQIKAKADLEAKLTQLEDAQRVFSKPRVFVKLDQ